VRIDVIAATCQHHVCHLPADLLNASFAAGNPEAGWLPAPETKQPERGKANLAGHASRAALGPAVPDIAPALGQQQQQPLGKVSEKALTPPNLEQKGSKQTAAGGGGTKSGKLSSASVPGLHSADQLSRRSVGGQFGSAGGAERRAVTDEQRLFALVLSSPSSMEQSRGGLPSQPSGGKQSSMPDGGNPVSVPLSKTRSLPKTAKGRVEQSTERPERSVRSDSAPLRGSSSMGCKPHGRPSDTTFSPSQLRLAAVEPKAAHAGGIGGHARVGSGHRPTTSSHAGQQQQKRPAGKVPAPATAAGKKHTPAAMVLVPMADDEQPGGSSDRNGRHHAPHKREAGHERAPFAASVPAAPHKAGKHGGAAAVRSNGFHARPSVNS